MHLKYKLKSSYLKLLAHIKILSIKQLTLLGFTLVALPLVMALLYSAIQVSVLSNQGANAIFEVAQLIKTNRELSTNINNMERYASQYIVLNDKDLLAQYQQQEAAFLTLLTKELTTYQDKNLDQLIEQAKQLTQKIAQQLIMPTQVDTPLVPLQQAFKQLVSTSKAINTRSNDLISLQAINIKKSANKLSIMLLNSLFIIPLIVVIAAVFIFLITTPLKQLTTKIKQLEAGNFEQKVLVKGSQDIIEIADALEMMRTRLQALELQKSSFIRHISHELKTPLAAIRVGIELLDDSSIGVLSVEQQEVCNIIRHSVNRLQQLIEDLLDFNIVLDSTSLQDSENILLAPVVNKVLEDRQLDIKHKQLKVHLAIKSISLTSNRKQLEVIFDNLLSNAIKFSPINGVINISAKVEQAKLRLCISDQGKGIASDVQAKIFDAFYQGEAPENTQIKSSGLGLTIVKELLMRLNGEITVKSQVIPPSGTQFYITLPKAKRQGDST